MSQTTNNPPASSSFSSASSRRLNPIYAVAILGGLLLILGSFLSWVNINAGTDTISTTGMGVSTASSQTNPLTKAIVETPGNSPGTISIGLGVVVIILAGLGMLQDKRGFAIAGIIIGVLSVAFMVFKLLQQMDDLKNNVNPLGIEGSVGIGLYLGVAGAVLALVGNILPLVLKGSSARV